MDVVAEKPSPCRLVVRFRVFGLALQMTCRDGETCSGGLSEVTSPGGNYVVFKNSGPMPETVPIKELIRLITKNIQVKRR